MHIKRAALATTLAFVFLALGLAGCADSGNGQVSGQVQVDGQPLPKGTIRFDPTDGKAPVTGGSIEAGRYSVRVPVGKAKVIISAPKVVGQKKVYNTPNSPVMDVTAEALPDKYNGKSELTLDVKAGANEKNWELKSK